MLNKQGKGKIDWCDCSFNPIAGKCLHNCSYCYMHSIWRRFPNHAKLQFKERYLDIKLPKKQCKIFIGSSTDMFGDWVPKEWIHTVFRFIRKNPQHIFQFLTKNPDRYWEFDFSEFKNCWFGTTVDGTEKTKNNLSCLVSAVDANIKFVSFEPLLKMPKLCNWDIKRLDWIIIGADSSRGSVKPPARWASDIIDDAKVYNIPVGLRIITDIIQKLKNFPKYK